MVDLDTLRPWSSLGGATHAGGFYIIFFGVGAVIVGILAGLNAAGPLWSQFILFSTLSVLTLWLFRKRLLQLTQGERRENVDSLVGETAVATEEIHLNRVGKAELRGKSWNARNLGAKPLVVSAVHVHAQADAGERSASRRIHSFLAGRTIESAAVADGNSLNRARAEAAFLPVAIVNPEMILKLTELIIGVAIVRERRPAPADRLI
jgi:inner membrane protein